MRPSAEAKENFVRSLPNIGLPKLMLQSQERSLILSIVAKRYDVRNGQLHYKCQSILIEHTPRTSSDSVRENGLTSDLKLFLSDYTFSAAQLTVGIVQNSRVTGILERSTLSDVRLGTYRSYGSAEAPFHEQMSAMVLFDRGVYRPCKV